MVRQCPRCKTKETVYKQFNSRQRCAKCGQEVKLKRDPKERGSIQRARFQPLGPNVDKPCGSRPRDKSITPMNNNGETCDNNAHYHDRETNLLVCGVHRRSLEA